MIALLLAFRLMPHAEAVVPPPDGGYPGANTAEGQNALLSLTTGGFNTAVGYFSLSGVTTGNFNTAIGAGALFVNTADENTATGVGALLSNTQGDFNTANGAFALSLNTTGERNTGIGDSALFSNTSGSRNTGNGNAALVTNTTGHDNTATGTFALQRNNGDFNTAIGASTLRANTSGMFNTAVGAVALNWNTTGSGNTAVGIQALLTNTTGMGNTAIGDAALSFNSTGSHNIALGFNAGVNLTGNNNIDIGNDGLTDESHTIRIGGTQTRTFIAGIRGRTTGNNDPIPVLIDSAGQLGTTISSRRFKKEIKPMAKASEAILALKPVTFHYKSDSKGTPQFGLIAEDVAKVDPDLVVRDDDGEIYTVRYDAVNTMLLNEFLKEHRKNQEQEAIITRLKSADATQEETIAKQQKQIEALTASVQKLSAQIELSEAFQQMALNNP
jgi:Chaperone of endosialidase